MDNAKEKIMEKSEDVQASCASPCSLEWKTIDDTIEWPEGSRVLRRATARNGGTRYDADNYWRHDWAAREAAIFRKVNTMCEWLFLENPE